METERGDRMKVDLTESEIETMQMIVAATYSERAGNGKKPSFDYVRELTHIYDKLKQAKQEVTE